MIAGIPARIWSQWRQWLLRRRLAVSLISRRLWKPTRYRVLIVKTGGLLSSPFRFNWRMTWSWRSTWPPCTATCSSTIFAGDSLVLNDNLCICSLDTKFINVRNRALLPSHSPISLDHWGLNWFPRIIEPYSKVQVDYVASKIGLPKTEVFLKDTILLDRSHFSRF